MTTAYSTKHIDQIQLFLAQKQAYAFLITNPVTIRYITGFVGLAPQDREVCLLVTIKQTALILPKMYEQEARMLKCVQQKSVTLAIQSERNALFAACKDYIPNTAKVLIEEDNLTVAEYKSIAKILPTTLLSDEKYIETIRKIKSETEIELLSKAAHCTSKTWDDVITYLQKNDYTKLTERDLAHFITKQAYTHNGEGLSFDTIVACGTGSAQPHYLTSNKYLTKNNLLLIDLGIVYQGYCGDLTRCVALGAIDKHIRNMYRLVHECNQQAIAACQAGITAGELYEVANNFFIRHSVEQFFLHALGHAVGLDVHELPRLGKNDSTILKPGMVLTIEPGLYFPKKFGIRIEEMVVVTDTGCVVLSPSAPSTLQSID